MSGSSEQGPTFGLKLKQLRVARDLTQERLAELANCSVQAIRFFESGKRRPSVGMAEHLAALLALAGDEQARFVALARRPLEEEAADGVKVDMLPTAAPLALAPLPAPEQPLIGREAEHNVLHRLLVEERRPLVTLVGAGGMGKTHLALEVVASLRSYFTDGVVFVPLAPLRAATYLPGAVATALQLPPGSEDVDEQLLTALANRQLLLLLDSFEGLLHQEEDAAVRWVNGVLQRAPRVQCLVTSRERLRLGSEQTFELGGLAVPTTMEAPERSDAVLLFLTRAQQAHPDFHLDSTNKEAVTRICQLLDGMPLGIELAATWVRVLTPAEIAIEIANNIDFLARANRDAAPRHRSMRAVFDHSWSLMDSNERNVLSRLALFRGGCTREAAQAVAHATLPLLAGLIDKSLVQRRQRTGQARFELHEVVRQFAAEKRQAQEQATRAEASNGDDARLAHYTYFYQLAATAKGHLQGVDQLRWLQILDEEHANLRAALDRCLYAHDSVRGLQLALQVEEYWYIRGHHREGLQRLRAFLTINDPALSPLERAKGYAAAAILAIGSGNYRDAALYLDEAEDAIRRSDDQMALSRLLRYRGLVALHEGQYVTATALATEAVTVATAANNRYELATALSHLAELALIQREYARALELGDRAIQLLRTLGDKNQLAGPLRRLAQAQLPLGQMAAAERNALESLLLNHEVGDQRGMAAAMIVLASVFVAVDKWPAAAQLLGAAKLVLSQAQTSLLPADQLVSDALWAQFSANRATLQLDYETGASKMAQQYTQPDELAWVHALL